ncbi:MAG: hypothetical protein BYD32DRAFT_22181 [Podila humilis]|nr:MAG: hypothetical protein BYD32DRAFT_22181 [Podila humilis]
MNTGGSVLCKQMLSHTHNHVSIHVLMHTHTHDQESFSFFCDVLGKLCKCGDGWLVRPVGWLVALSTICRSMGQKERELHLKEQIVSRHN